MTTPSTGTRSPARTATTSPAATLSAGTRSADDDSRPGAHEPHLARRTRSASAASARVALRRPSDSSHLPSSTIAVIIAADSKYVGPLLVTAATALYIHAVHVPRTTSVSMVARPTRAAATRRAGTASRRRAAPRARARR